MASAPPTAPAARDAPTGLSAEFDRQVAVFLEKGYAAAAGLSLDAFLRHVEPLRNHLSLVPDSPPDLEAGRLAFLVVVTRDLVTTEDAMCRVELHGRTGVIRMFPRTPRDFTPRDDVPLPPAPVYLLVDVDRGQATRNVAPHDALAIIRRSGRSPLTLDEGIAAVTHYPDFLRKNHCFSLLASRCSGDKRVPAIWITREKRPNLGWCWDGNPHTWLGSASCASRLSP
ncbi:MAG TPA: DUF5701 family protein [Chloroflexota bacterium]|nr:DUF5701 family protein [Chloroflexota bacterium]